ncbi:hypothetical protein PV08_07811 [Exophiala spinifera]|uniref:Acyltransferase 3 domain-containing protein n=1 Tax=Exophiala spinifera TaxID=91928 RepID=A0A0D2BUZ5_9EURO|nr:uncharacterized protein PV08_07811 [Exophiala spinifera]KIW15024.1 hypothetical protein PV08_07811 [Exophiala spinifera]
MSVNTPELSAVSQHDHLLEEALPALDEKASFSGAGNFVTRIVRRGGQVLSTLWHGKPKKTLHRTAYLDGVRGFAALLVYILHHQVWGHHAMGGMFILENAFGYEDRYYFASLPFFRTFFSGGHLAVAVFFVISGYALSTKSLAAIHHGDTTRLADLLSSALFRRWFRLYLPCAVVTFAWMTSWHLFGLRSFSPGAMQPEETYLADVRRWYDELQWFSFAFREYQSNKYNDHLWSIPHEFRGSIAVFTCLLALSKCRRNARLFCETVLVVYFLFVVDAWYCALFIAGMLFCDLDLLAVDGDLPAPLAALEPHKSYIFYLLLAVGLYVGNVPTVAMELEHIRESPGWYYLSFLKPRVSFDPRFYFQSLGAICIIPAIPRIPRLRAFFETSFCQYLGRVSFALYLVHGPILWCFGDRIYAATGRVRDESAELVPNWVNLCPFPSWGPFGLEINFLMAHVVLLSVTLWTAQIVTKVVDEPSVRLASRLFQSLGEKQNPPIRRV